MATANKLNESYQNFLETSDISPLLNIVREHTIAKFSYEEEHEDIAQECLLSVWRSLDPNCMAPLTQFDAAKSSFSSWLARRIMSVCAYYKRVYGQKEATFDANNLDQLEFEMTDPWSSEGRSWSSACPSESFYYEGDRRV
jgi:DNA-directed RNA polymerase specialized sigma24 family protein